MDWWTIVNRCAAREHCVCVAANQGASLRHYPPYSWPGGSQVIDTTPILAKPAPAE